MARYIIDTGTAGNSATGDTVRAAMTKVNNNFEQLFNDSTGSNNIIIAYNTLKAIDTNGNVQILSNGTGQIELNQLSVGADGSISTLNTNGDITLSPNGTGGVVLGDVTVSDNKISSNRSNDDLVIQASGTGHIVAGALRINGTTISADDSTKITIAESMDVTGATTLSSTLSVNGATTLSSTLAVTGASTLSSTLAVTGATTLSGGATVSGDTTTGSLTTNSISSNGSNADISIQPSGTGNVVIGSLTLNGSTISATDSTQINLNDHVQLDGNVGFHGTTPVAQQSAISYTSDGSTKNDVAIDEILTVLRNYGLIAT